MGYDTDHIMIKRNAKFYLWHQSTQKYQDENLSVVCFNFMYIIVHILLLYHVVCLRYCSTMCVDVKNLYMQIQSQLFII